MTIQISAQELSEFCFPQGSLGVMPSVERMNEGTAAHKKLQNAYKENEKIKYRREVPFERIYEKNGFSIKLQGRADGVFYDKDFWYIHEIKSTYCAPESIEKPLYLAHKAQMMIYASIFAQEEGLTVIKCRLSYFCLADDKIVDLEYSFDVDALNHAIEQMVDEYALLVALRLKALNDFKNSAKALAFPFDSYRIGQREGATQIFSALKKNKNLFLQAPTGTGKTLMTLFPTVKYLAEDDAKVFCLSAKNQTMAVNDQAFELMRKKGLKIKTCTITAKSKACLTEGQNCDPESCPYSLNYYKKLHDALPEILQLDAYTPQVIRELGEKYQLCPYELSLDLSLEANAVICDYNYLFDPSVYLRRYFDQSGKYIFLIDEAHNLIERGRDMFSAVITQAQLRDAKKLFDKTHPLYRSFGKILTELNKLLKAEAIVFNDLKDLTFAILNNNDKLYEAMRYSVVPSEAILLQKELLRFNVICEYFDFSSFKLYSRGTRLEILCLDPSAMLESSIEKSFSTILYSATLSPYEYYKNSILPQAESFGFSTAYPFNKDNLRVLADYSIDTRYTNRDKYYAIIADKIKKVQDKAKGNILVYFPSYAFMNSVNEEYKNEALIQPAESDELSRKEFLDMILPTSEHAVFLVMGSHFSEGIDIKNIKGIVIVGVGLPQYNDNRLFLQEHFEEKFKKGFEYTYVYPGINKVCQASGRLIRNEYDKGFILLMDGRFRRYASLLPPHWQIEEIRSYDDLFFNE